MLLSLLSGEILDFSWLPMEYWPVLTFLDFMSAFIVMWPSPCVSLSLPECLLTRTSVILLFRTTLTPV